MCGITGFTHSRHEAARGRIQDSVATLVHRGPDQQGCFESEAVSLGATRLKIIDLGGGDQPIISAGGDVVIAFNGEIYNHLELRRELEQRGHKFRSHTDTETVLEAFLEWDTDCFARLRGMFAIALWTESGKRLILARDRMGIKPLYIARREGEIYFGSELKAIFVHPEIERRLSLHGLDCYLALNYVPCPWTLVEGIEKLRPGHWLEWRSGKVREETFWELPLRPAGKWTSESAQEELDRLLRESVKEHLLSDVPLGVWLSGGVDSSTVLHYASQAAGSPLRTYSISFQGRSFDESAYIQETASYYGTRHEQLDLNEDAGLQDSIEEFAYYSDDPNADAGALPVWFLSRMTSRSATVALSGEGADELFGGYVTYRADAMARRLRRMPKALLRLAGAAAGYLPVSDEKISFEYKVKRFLEGTQLPPERAHVFWNGAFSDRGKRELVQVPLPAALIPILDVLRRAGDNLKAELYFDQRYYLADDLLSKVDRMSMAHSLEVRPPFLDHRLVEFAASLPDHLLIEGNRHKVVLKELMKGKLPGSILGRKKVGLDIPAHEWLRGPLRPLLMDTMEAGLSAYPDLFRRAAVENCLKRHFGKIENLGYHLWGLMILFLWMRRWKIEAAADVTAVQQVRGGLFTST